MNQQHPDLQEKFHNEKKKHAKFRDIMHIRIKKISFYEIFYFFKKQNVENVTQK